MAQRFALQSLWRATRNRLAELNRRLAEGGDPNEMVFQARPSNLTQSPDRERAVEARNARARAD
jgi:hypothetical protein